MRRVTALLLCLAVMVSNFIVLPDISKAAADDFVVSASYITPDFIKQGTEFEFEVAITNVSGSAKNVNTVGVKNGASFNTISTFKFTPGVLQNGDTVLAKARLKSADGSETVIVTLAGGLDYYIDLHEFFVPLKDREPKLNISGDVIFPSGEAGQEIKFDLPIKNTSKYNAQSVVVTLDIADIKEFPFDLSGTSMSKQITTISGNQTKNIPLTYMVRKDAMQKSYPIKYKMVYSNGYGDSFESTETIYVKINSDYVPPQVEAFKTEYMSTSLQPQKELVAGQENLVKVFIRNNGQSTSKNILVKLEGFKSDVLTLLDSNNQKIVPMLASKGQTQLNFIIKPNKALKSGYYPVTYTSEYKDEFGNAQKVTNEIFLPVRGTTGMVSDVSVVKLSAPSTVKGTGKDFQVVASIKNHSTYQVENLKVMLEMDPALVPKTISIVNIEKLAPGETKDIKFTVFAGPAAESKNYPITVKLSTEGSEAITGGYVGVFVNGSAGVGTPRVMITGYEFEGDNVNAGEPFDIKLTFQNTNAKDKIQNLKITLSPDGDLLPVKSSNAFFIDALGPKASFTKKITLKTKGALEGEDASTIFKIEYEDTSGKAMPLVEEKISLPIVQPTRFEVGEPKLPMEVFVGEPARITIDFYNMGKAKVRNLMVKSEGDFDARNKSYYYGNFDSGKTDYYDLNLTAFKEGEMEVKVQFSYENAIGQVKTIDKSFKLNVVPAPVYEEVDPNLVPPEEATGPSKWIFVGVGAAVIVVGVVIWRKRRAKKLREQELEFDE